MVLESCGVADVVERIPSGGLAASITFSGAAASWGPLALTAVGGQYRLCWCSQNTALMIEKDLSVDNATTLAPCDWTESFDLDIGEFTLLGPRPLRQDRTPFEAGPYSL